MPNPDDMQRYVLIPVTEPYDIAGFNLLLWRYRDERQDVNLAYIPAIRRIRRMSPANRSDSFVGSDFCIDDPWGYDGKVLMFEWKFLRKQEALVAYQSVDPELIVLGKRKGEWQTTQEVTPGLFGYEKEGWQGAPWAPVNFVWVKKTVYVIEAVSKDSYYNYGRQEIWYDPELFHFKYKIVYDRAGKYWKTMSIGMGGCESRDKDMRLMMLNLQHMVGDRTRHAAMLERASKKNRWVFWAEMDMNDSPFPGLPEILQVRGEVKSVQPLEEERIPTRVTNGSGAQRICYEDPSSRMPVQAFPASSFFRSTQSLVSWTALHICSAGRIGRLGAMALASPDERPDVEYIIAGKYSNWKEVVTGRQKPLRP